MDFDWAGSSPPHFIFACVFRMSTLVDAIQGSVKMSLMSQFAKILKHMIETKQVAVTDVAAAAECSRQHIYDIINKRTEITLGLAQKISEFCGFTVEVKGPGKKSG